MYGTTAAKMHREKTVITASMGKKSNNNKYVIQKINKNIKYIKIYIIIHDK